MFVELSRIRPARISVSFKLSAGSRRIRLESSEIFGIGAGIVVLSEEGIEWDWSEVFFSVKTFAMRLECGVSTLRLLWAIK